jgi:16S rRNA (adenine1518-N6/adenine1519-N6)-dimethyltransferase
MGHRLGQHFLKSEGTLQKITRAINVQRGDVIVEIGPGHGELTQLLVRSGVTVVAVEKDSQLANALAGNFQLPLFNFQKNLNIPKTPMGGSVVIAGDALKVLPLVVGHLLLADSRYKVVGNIPYYITGRLFRVLGELEHKPQRAVFLIQKEVAQRLCAQPGAMNLLAATTQVWAQCRVVAAVPRHLFSPPPRVDSAIVMLEKLPAPSHSLPVYFAAAHILFKQPRKTILNNLIGGGVPKNFAYEALEKIDCNEKSRPQELSTAKIYTLAVLLERFL